MEQLESIEIKHLVTNLCWKVARVYFRAFHPPKLLLKVADPFKEESLMLHITMNPSWVVLESSS